ncbi:hypothetical protein ACIPMU_34310 [Streptomyces cyaneofuscatus]|uniref:hypothetical protein n=1 Tax=Streptomyces cyaneofuscatus TaxID=66883 RepID=UPI003814D4E4
MVQTLAAAGELQRELTYDGLRAAKAKGAKDGRRPAVVAAMAAGVRTAYLEGLSIADGEGGGIQRLSSWPSSAHTLLPHGKGSTPHRPPLGVATMSRPRPDSWSSPAARAAGRSHDRSTTATRTRLTLSRIAVTRTESRRACSTAFVSSSLTIGSASSCTPVSPHTVQGQAHQAPRTVHGRGDPRQRLGVRGHRARSGLDHHERSDPSG